MRNYVRSYRDRTVAFKRTAAKNWTLHCTPQYTKYTRYTAVHRGTPRYTAAHHGTPRYTRYTAVHRGTPRYTTVHRGTPPSLAASTNSENFKWTQPNPAALCQPSYNIGTEHHIFFLDIDTLETICFCTIHPSAVHLIWNIYTFFPSTTTHFYLPPQYKLQVSVALTVLRR
jgi:hypothetical protein